MTGDIRTPDTEPSGVHALLKDDHPKVNLTADFCEPDALIDAVGTRDSISADRFHIHRGLDQILDRGVQRVSDAIAAHFNDEAQIRTRDIAKAMCETVRSAIHVGHELREFCDVRIAQEEAATIVDPEIMAVVRPIRNEVIKEVAAFLEKERDPTVPLKPDSINPFRPNEFPDSPWLQVYFDFADPESGVTEGTGHPHYMLIRLPEELPEDMPRTSANLRKLFLKWAAQANSPFLMRMHSRCEMGDCLASQTRCACGPQYTAAMNQIEKAGFGAFIYLQQEGRGISLLDKAKAHMLADGFSPEDGSIVEEAHDTESAQAAITGSSKMDMRRFEFVVRAVKGVGLGEVAEKHGLELMTNNRSKAAVFTEAGIPVDMVSPKNILTSEENLEEEILKVMYESYEALEFWQIKDVLNQIISKLNGGKERRPLIQYAMKRWHWFNNLVQTWEAKQYEKKKAANGGDGNEVRIRDRMYDLLYLLQNPEELREIFDMNQCLDEESLSIIAALRPLDRPRGMDDFLGRVRLKIAQAHEEGTK